MTLRFSTLFTLLFLCCCHTLVAQSSDLKVSPESVSKEVVVNMLEADFEDISTLRLTNTTNQDLQLQWTKTIERQPREWKTYVYSKKPGFGPYSGKQYKEEKNFTLKAGQTMEYYLVLRPNNKSGKGRITLSFSNVIQPTVFLESVVFDFNVINRIEETAPKSSSRRKITRVYPNPAVDNFFVELPSSVKAGKVEIFNTLGRKLKTFPKPDLEKGYPINDLPEGIYLINIYDSKGEKIRTLRLLHRRFGA